MLKSGDSSIASVYVRSTKIGTIFRGDTLVYQGIKIPETDIALYDNVNKYEITVSTSKYNATDYPTNRYTPVGVVVIPANMSKDLFPEGDDRKGKPIIMSLKYMRYDTPDEGGEAQTMCWGGYGTDLTLNNFQKHATVPNNSEDEEATVSAGYARLPSTKFSGTECKVAPKTKYAAQPYHPSPVKFDNERGKWVLNPQFKNAPNTCACTDVDGKANTATILENVTVVDWQTSPISNSSSSGNYPAACCCWRYHIEGVDNKGDWYLPSLGELCFIIPFFTQHNNALTKIRNTYNTSVAVLLGTDYTYWSSSEYSSTIVWHIYTYNGNVYFGSKGGNKYVRAFRPLKVGANVGDIILVNKTTLKKIVVPISSLQAYSTDEYKAIGVVMIPQSHNVYGNGEFCVVATKAASLTTPDEGTSTVEYMYFGGISTSYSELGTFNNAPRYGTKNSTTISEYINGVSAMGNVPVSAQNAPESVNIPNPHDSSTSYYGGNKYAVCGYFPSPYTNNGDRNPDYYSTDSPSTTSNFLSDFNGKYNTEVICSYVSGNKWKTNTTLSNSYSDDSQPAVCACWRYHTLGTEQGDWYLPTVAELGYFSARYDTIKASIEAVSLWEGGTMINLSKTLWTSTMTDNKMYGNSHNAAYTISPDLGTIDYSPRSQNSLMVIPTLRLKL